MKYEVQINQDNILALSDESYLENTLTQESDQTNFAGISDINLYMKYPNFILSSNDTETILKYPLNDNIYIKSGNDYVKYEGGTESVSTSLVPVLTADSDKVSGIENAWKVFNNDASNLTLNTDDLITYNFSDSVIISRFIIKGTGSFKIEGSVDNTNFTVLSQVSSDTEKQSVLDGTMLNIEASGNYQYYKITALENSTMDYLKYFDNAGDKLLTGNLSEAYIINTKLFFNTEPAVIDTIQIVNNGSDKVDCHIRYKDFILNISTLTTRFELTMLSEFIEYSSNVYRKL